LSGQWQRTWSMLAAAGAVSLSGTAWGQATFFQVPSGEITKPADFYVQQQSTLSKGTLDVVAQVAIGVGAGVDVALNLYNTDIDRHDGRFRLLVNDERRDEPFGPLVLLGAQKEFVLVRDLGLTFGAQVGPNVGGNDTRIAARGYANGTLALGENWRCAAGGYVANGILLGGPTVQGAPWAGCDIEVLHEVVEVAADWDFGKHANGGIIVGPQFRVTSAIGIAIGVRAPNPWAKEAQWAGVLQFEVKDPLSG